MKLTRRRREIVKSSEICPDSAEKSLLCSSTYTLKDREKTGENHSLVDTSEVFLSMEEAFFFPRTFRSITMVVVVVFVVFDVFASKDKKKK